MIVGQGLAGSCLALELAAHKKKLVVFNNAQGHSSSRVAGGLINPVTGRKMVLTWKAHQLFPFLNRFYTAAMVKLENNFYRTLPLYRPFVSTEEQNEWQGKSVEAQFAPFVEAVVTASEAERMVKDPFGGLLLKQSGYLDTDSFINSVAKWLKKEHKLVNAKFDAKDVNFNEDVVVYKEIKAGKIIFCEGVGAIQNPYFPEIKFRPVKGEVLTIMLDTPLHKIYNRGVFVLPREGSCTVGSNYNHKDLTWEPTNAGKEEISKKLNELLLKPYKIVGHKAGVRPSVADRRPVLGASRQNEHMIIFNGLGTKGVSLAPYFAHQLANWLLTGSPIDKEVHINRFF